MADFRLTTKPAPAIQAGAATTTFYWTGAGDSPSFRSRFGPGGGYLGPVNELNADFVRIAVSVRAADGSLSRGTRWRAREFKLTVPVSDPTAWREVRPELTRMLGFLTGDNWQLLFVKESLPPEAVRMPIGKASQVVLLSGGADSATGALLSALALAQGEQQILLSHFSSNHLSPIQRDIAGDIRRLAPNTTLDHVQLRHLRRRFAPDGSAYGRENSSRSRSLLFIALGLAAASVREVPLLIPENGFASINPPLGYNRRGSLSTKTTHPRLLGGVSDLLQRVGAHGELLNPYAHMTKGEMFLEVKAKFGDSEASRYLSQTNSCSHSGARTYGIYPKVHCGVCFGCVLRRASFHAADLVDSSSYLNPESDPKQIAWLEEKSVVDAVRAFVRTPPTDLDFASLRLPEGHSIHAARELSDRAVAELRNFIL